MNISPEMILIWLFVVGVFGGLLFAAFNLIGAAIYDMMEVRQSNKLRKVPNNKVYRHRPLLSIVIPVHNEKMVIERCLDSLLKSSCRKFEIIIADDKSSDNTREIVRAYIKSHPNRSIRLVAKRLNGGRGAAIDAGLRHAKGDLVMALDADCMVAKYALRNMVRHFADGRTAAVAANIRIMDTGNMISLLQQFDYLISFRSKKFNTVANCEYIIGGAGATYQRSVIEQLKGFDHSMQTEDIEMSLRIARVLGNNTKRLKYASNVVIFTEPVPTYKSLFKQRFRWKFGSLQAMYKHRQLLFSFHREHSKLLTLLRLPFVLWCELLLVLEPIYFGYFLYLAIINRNATLFASASLVMTLLIAIVVWSDEHLAMRSRLRLSVYAPMMYLAFFIMTAIQVGAAIKSFINVHGLIGKRKVVGAYVSPERIGQNFNVSS
ncbi:MAG TPA: glycosyltransferase [Candidatus Saccharimonadales bacterium]|nr:glycosyltransferase [Candidatus Saccharimonadales bacterium]